MRFVFDTPLKAIGFPAKVRPPGDTLVAVVKATLDLVPGGTATLAAAQSEIVATEELFEDAYGNSCRYPSDLAPVKPMADILVTGSCHPPGGRAQRCDVTVEVGAWRKSIAVFGNRYWMAAPGAQHIDMTEPRSFSHMPLRYELALGDPSDEANPYGRGFEKERTAEGRVYWPLPNLEYPDRLLASPEDRPPPAGLTPLSEILPERQRRHGTYDEVWMRRRRPYPPDDLDWTLYNAAPEDQRLPEFLAGDERIRLVHMHPAHPVVDTRLPGVAPHVYLHCHHAGQPRWNPVPLRLDTLWIDAEALQAVLVWRGRARLPRHREQAEDVVFVYHESGAADEGPERAWQRYLAATEGPPPDLPAAPAEDDRQRRIDAHLAAARARLASGGAPPELLEALAAERDPARFERLMLAWCRRGAASR